MIYVLTNIEQAKNWIFIGIGKLKMLLVHHRARKQHPLKDDPYHVLNCAQL